MANFLQKCGTSLKADDRFCPQCGAVIEPSPSQNENGATAQRAVPVQPAMTKHKSINPILVFGICAIMLIGFCTIVFGNRQSQKPQEDKPVNATSTASSSSNNNSGPKGRKASSAQTGMTFDLTLDYFIKAYDNTDTSYIRTRGLSGESLEGLMEDCNLAEKSAKVADVPEIGATVYQYTFLYYSCILACNVNNADNHVTSLQFYIPDHLTENENQGVFRDARILGDRMYAALGFDTSLDGQGMIIDLISKAAVDNTTYSEFCDGIAIYTYFNPEVDCIVFGANAMTEDYYLKHYDPSLPTYEGPAEPKYASTPKPTPTSKPTRKSTPKQTPKPTPKSTPTAKPTPTPTPTPTPAPTPDPTPSPTPVPEFSSTNLAAVLPEMEGMTVEEAESQFSPYFSVEIDPLDSFICTYETEQYIYYIFPDNDGILRSDNTVNIVKK